MTLRPNHCAASIFVTLFCTVSSATGVDYVTTPGDLQGFAVDQSPFDKNGDLVRIPIASCAIADFGDSSSRGRGTTQWSLRNGILDNWTFFIKFTPILLITLNPPAALVAISYQYFTTPCTRHVWNMSINGDTSVTQVTASYRSMWYLIGPNKLNRLVANFTLQLNTDDDIMTTCLPQNANFKMSVSSLSVYTTKLTRPTIAAVTSQQKYANSTWPVFKHSTHHAGILTSLASRTPHPGHMNFTHQSTRTPFVTGETSDPLSTSRSTSRITNTSHRKTTWTSQNSQSAESSPYVTFSPIQSLLSRSANTGSQAVPPTTVSDSQLKESTLSFTGSISEQDHHPQSTEEIDIYSSSTHSSEFSGKMTNLTTEETVTASSSPTKGDQSNDYSSYSTGATVYTDIAFTNAMTTSDESMTVAGSKSSTLAQSTLTQPESSSTGVGSHAISDGTQSPQSLTTDDTNRVNMTVTGRLDTSTLSAAATAMSLSDEKRTTAKTSMPLTSSVRTTAHTTTNDVVYKCSFRIKSMKFVSSMSDHDSSTYSVVYNIVYPLLNSSFASSFGSNFVRILAVSFSPGSVIVQNWVVLNQTPAADQINLTQSTVFDAFQSSGYETDDFIMVIDTSYANEVTLTQTTVNILVIALVAGLVVIVIVVVVSLSVIACRRQRTSPAVGGRPPRWRPSDLRDSDRRGAIMSSITSDSSQSLSSTLSASVDGFSLPRYGLRLPRAQLVNTMWQTIPTVSAFHQANDHVKRRPSSDPIDDDDDEDAIYRQVEATRSRLNDFQPTADETDSGNQTMHSTDERSVDRHRPEMAWAMSGRNAMDCDYFGSPAPKLNDESQLRRGRLSPVTGRWDDDDVMIRTRDGHGGGGGGVDNSRRVSGMRRLLRRLPMSSKSKVPAEKEIPDVDFGGLFVPTFRPVSQSGLRRQWAERDLGNAARGAGAVYAFPVATGGELTGNSPSLFSAPATTSAGTTANRPMTSIIGGRPADDAVPQSDTSDVAAASVAWFTRTAIDEHQNPSVSEFVQDDLPSLFVPVNNSPRKKNKQKNDLLHRS